MKTFSLPFLIIIISIISCTNTPGTHSDAMQGEKAAPPLRDLSITAANSYSDLFLDSNIVEQKVAGIILVEYIVSNAYTTGARM